MLPVQTLFEENKRSQKQAQKKSRFQYLASFHIPCTSSLRALQAGALSRITVMSLLLQNWAIFHKPLIQLMLSSFVHGKVLEGKSQHPPTHSYKPWHSLSPSVPQPIHRQFLSHLDCEEHYGDTLKPARPQLVRAGPCRISAHSFPREYTEGINS